MLLLSSSMLDAALF